MIAIGTRIKKLNKFMKSVGIINDIGVNKEAIAAILKYFNNIPVPCHSYDKFVKLYAGRNDFNTALSAVIAHCSVEYLINCCEKEKVTGERIIEMDELLIPAFFIRDYFNIENPTKDESEKFYIFSLKDSVKNLLKEGKNDEQKA